MEMARVEVVAQRRCQDRHHRDRGVFIVWVAGVSSANHLVLSLTDNSSLNNSSSGGSRLLDQPPGLYTAYRAFLSKDAGGVAARSLKQIQAGRRTQRPIAAQSALLRKHLLQLTQSFMIPLER